VSARVRRRRALAALLVLLLAVGVWTATSGRRDASAGAAAAAAGGGGTAAAASASTTSSATARTPTATTAPSPTASGASTAASGNPSGATDSVTGTAAAAASQPPPAEAGTLAQVAGLGQQTAATVPASSTQAVVVRGDGATVATAGIELYERDARGWRRTGAWRGHVGAAGWTDTQGNGDLGTPAGTFGLSGAGGRLPDPGTELPYRQSSDYAPIGDGGCGDSPGASFDYVLAIDGKRVPGGAASTGGQSAGAQPDGTQSQDTPSESTPSESTQPAGATWLQVDHDGPTKGCVAVPEDGLRTLLRALLPAADPVVVMGDRDRLAG
jgi:L,D-peptidoglycan transpeptidase YkuD (ErfK/YbiS/YcfS/YnhG family)